MDGTTRPPTWKVLLAFSIVYFVWGSTFLAIRVGVREVPPFLLAGMRFCLAGAALYAWMRVQGTASPTSRQWTAAALLAVPIFVLDYGLVFWAERRVPSGTTAVMMATIPVFIAGCENSRWGDFTHWRSFGLSFREPYDPLRRFVLHQSGKTMHLFMQRTAFVSLSN